MAPGAHLAHGTEQLTNLRYHYDERWEAAPRLRTARVFPRRSTPCDLLHRKDCLQGFRFIQNPAAITRPTSRARSESQRSPASGPGTTVTRSNLNARFASESGSLGFCPPGAMMDYHHNAGQDSDSESIELHFHFSYFHWQVTSLLPESGVARVRAGGLGGGRLGNSDAQGRAVPAWQCQ